jgi:hypothetical protein
MMCSSEHSFVLSKLGFEKKKTCDSTTDVYLDKNKPTQFNIDALMYMYGKDGFELPNKHLALFKNHFKYSNSPITISNNVRSNGTLFTSSNIQ